MDCKEQQLRPCSVVLSFFLINSFFSLSLSRSSFKADETACFFSLALITSMDFFLWTILFICLCNRDDDDFSHLTRLTRETKANEREGSRSISRVQTAAMFALSSISFTPKEIAQRREKSQAMLLIGRNNLRRSVFVALV